MPARNQIATALISVLVLSGCSSPQESLGIAPESVVEDSDTRPSSAIDQETIDRIKAEEDLQKELDSRVESTEQQPQPNTSETTAPAPEETLAGSLDNIEISIASKAFGEVSRFLDGSYTGPVNLNIYEGVSASEAREIEGYLQKAISSWDETYGVIEDFNLVVFNRDGMSWADSIRVENGDSVPSGTLVKDNCNFVFILHSTVYLCLREGIPSSILESIVPHEYFHSLQYSLGIDHTNLPLWIAEGSASYVGDVHMFSTPGSLKSKFRNGHHDSMYRKLGSYNINGLKSSTDIESFRAAFVAMEVYTDQHAMQVIVDYPVYTLGSVAFELLIGTHGIQEFLNFLEVVGSGTYWKNAFNDHFGVTTTEFYEDVLEYIVTDY